jgi:hypothetical protein
MVIQAREDNSLGRVPLQSAMCVCQFAMQIEWELAMQI